jgi:hypothetical protein
MFGLLHCLVDLYKCYISHDPEVKNDPPCGPILLHSLYGRHVSKLFFFKRTMPRDKVFLILFCVVGRGL